MVWERSNLTDFEYRNEFKPTLPPVRLYSGLPRLLPHRRSASASCRLAECLRRGSNRTLSEKRGKVRSLRPYPLSMREGVAVRRPLPAHLAVLVARGEQPLAPIAAGALLQPHRPLTAHYSPPTHHPPSIIPKLHSLRNPFPFPSPRPILTPWTFSTTHPRPRTSLNIPSPSFRGR